MDMKDKTTDALTGTVKGPGELPHEFLFITADNKRARIGEFVYYTARDGEASDTSSATSLARDLVPQSARRFSLRPAHAAGGRLRADRARRRCGELYEITVETIGYFSRALGDFVNPRIPPNPGDPVFLASSETLSDCA